MQSPTQRPIRSWPRRLGVALCALSIATSLPLDVLSASTVPGMTETQKEKECKRLKDSYDYLMNYYREKPRTRSKFKAAAANVKLIAEGIECDWVATPQ